MTVTIICGSPRRDGNTELLLSMLEKELYEKSIAVNYVKLADLRIDHCIHCDKCRNMNRCIQNDDFNEVYDIVIKNEGLVIGTPVYVGAPTSLILAFIQRLTYVSFNNEHKLDGKVGAPIAIAGEVGQLTAINCLVDFYLVNGMIIPGSTYWNIAIGSKKGDVLKDEKGKKYLKIFSETFVHVLKTTKEYKK